MPLFYQQDINAETRLGLWRIEEPEAFFQARVPMQREITHPHKRLQHLAGRFLLRELFADFPMDLIRIADTRKPFVADESFHFSISHCGPWAAAIASNTHRVGVDVEASTSRVLRILDKFLHPEERHMLDTFQDTASVGPLSPAWGNSEADEKPHAKYQEIATMLWSIKESVFKWDGIGGVDFSEMIRVEALPVEAEGQVPGWFARDTRIPLRLHFKAIGDLCLSYVVTDLN